MMPTCTQARTAPFFYSSLDLCLTTCRSLPDVPPYTVADGTLPDKNDAQCRLFHATSAVMDPDEHWRVLSMAILLGGHVRVGMEDNPFLSPGEYAQSNAQLVEKIVRISRELGREIATPDEARSMIWPEDR